MNKVRYWVGLWLLALNYPMAWAGAAVSAIFYLHTKQHYWLAIGSGFYIFSWLMLIAGFILAGSEGLQHLHFFWRRTVKRLKLLHIKVNNEKDTGSPGSGV